MKIDSPLLHPYFGLIVGTLAVSTSAVFVKLATAPGAVVAFYRLFFTILIMTPFMLYAYRRELTQIQGKDWLFSSLSGLFLALHFILWFESLQYTSVASSVVLVTLQPLFTFIGAYFFFREKLGKGAILGGCMAFLGSIIIFWGDFEIGGLAFFGNVLALLGAMMVSGYWLFGQHVRKRLSLMTYTYVVYGISTALLLMYTYLQHQPVYPYPTEDWIIFFCLAAIPTLLGHTLFNWTLKWLSASVVSMSILFEPIGASVLAYFILGETLHAAQWLGGGVILSGIYIFIRSYEQKQTTAAVDDGPLKEDPAYD